MAKRSTYKTFANDYASYTNTMNDSNNYNSYTSEFKTAPASNTDVLTQKNQITGQTNEGMYSDALNRAYMQHADLSANRSLLSRTLDALMVFNHAGAGFAKGLVDGNSKGSVSPLQGFVQGLKASNPFGDGYHQGEYNYSQVLGAAGWNPTSLGGRVAKGVTGFIGDVLLDPTTYISGGSSALIKGSGKLAVEGVAKATAEQVAAKAGIPLGNMSKLASDVFDATHARLVDQGINPDLAGRFALKKMQDTEQISGIFDTVKGNSETGVYTAQGILALQEAGQARIRLKVKLLEASLSKLACLWYSRMQQFWKSDRFVRITRQDGSYDFKKFLKSSYENDYDIKITAGSTMSVNRGAMLDLMIRLAQTQMPDGQMLVDRQAVAEYLPEEIKSSLLRRVKGEQGNLDKLQKEVQQLAQTEQDSEKKTMDVINQLTGAVEKINNQILQLKQAHDTMLQKQKQESALASAKDSGYNTGFTDAQKQLQSSNPTDPNANGGNNVDMGQGAGVVPQLPDSMLQGIHNMTNDELKLLVQSHPELVNMINQAVPHQ